jgi:hypothetical protein
MKSFRTRSPNTRDVIFYQNELASSPQFEPVYTKNKIKYQPFLFRFPHHTQGPAEQTIRLCDYRCSVCPFFSFIKNIKHNIPVIIQISVFFSFLPLGHIYILKEDNVVCKPFGCPTTMATGMD